MNVSPSVGLPAPHPASMATMSTTDTILLVEDNEDDVFGLRRAIKKAGVDNPLRVTTDGQKAVDYLTAAADPSRSAEYPLPFLVLLDLKLPYRDGFEVLEWIRSQEQLARVVVVMLTGSDERRDHQRAYALGARSYLVKPASADDIKRLLESLHSHWTRPGIRSPETPKDHSPATADCPPTSSG